MSDSAQMLHRTFSRTLLTWSTLALFSWTTTLLSGQNVQFVATLDVKEVVVGIPFEVSFTLTNAEAQRFTPPSFREFKSAGAVSESRGMSIVRGQTISRQSWTYALEATRPGSFFIAPASITVNGRVYSTAPLTVKVLSPAASSKGVVNVPPGRDDQVFIVGNLSAQKVFPGQQVTWRLVLYTRVAIEGADLISLPDFDGFYSKEKRRFDTRVQYQTIKGKKYAVKTLHEESLFPQSTGSLTIGAAQIRVGLDQPGTQGFFFGPKPVTLSSQALTLTVMPLPEPVPETFTGGVGHYEWEVKSDTTSLTTDDALTLTVSLKGNGDARRFSSPKIQVPPTCEIFDPRVIEEDEYETESEMVHTKRLEYVVLPKEPGMQEFIPVLTYYDTDSNKYCNIQAAAIRFEVTPGKNYHLPNNDDSLSVPLQTVVQVGLWEKISGWLESPLLWGALLAAFVVFILLLIFRKRGSSPAPVVQQKPSADPVVTAKQRFAQAATFRYNSNPVVFYNELLKSLQSYIAARLNLSPAQLNHAVLRTKLAERSVTPIRVQAFLSILQTCEQAVFSGHTDASTMESDWRTAEVVVQELEKEIR